MFGYVSDPAAFKTSGEHVASVADRKTDVPLPVLPVLNEMAPALGVSSEGNALGKFPGV